MRDGNEGIDLNISFLPPLRFGDIPSVPHGGETLFPFGEMVFTPLLGDMSPLRISGVSSSAGDLKWLTILCWTGKSHLLSVCDVGYTRESVEDREGFPLERRGGLTKGL